MASLSQSHSQGYINQNQIQQYSHNNNQVSQQQQQNNIYSNQSKSSCSSPSSEGAIEFIAKLFPKCRPKSQENLASSEHKTSKVCQNESMTSNDRRHRSDRLPCTENGITNTSCSSSRSSSSSTTSSPVTFNSLSSSSTQLHLIGNIPISCYDESPRRYRFNHRRHSSQIKNENATSIPESGMKSTPGHCFRVIPNNPVRSSAASGNLTSHSSTNRTNEEKLTGLHLVSKKSRRPLFESPFHGNEGEPSTLSRQREECSSSSSSLDSPPPYPPPPPPDMPSLDKHDTDGHHLINSGINSKQQNNFSEVSCVNQEDDEVKNAFKFHGKSQQNLSTSLVSGNECSRNNSMKRKGCNLHLLSFSPVSEDDGQEDIDDRDNYVYQEDEKMTFSPKRNGHKNGESSSSPRNDHFKCAFDDTTKLQVKTSVRRPSFREDSPSSSGIMSSSRRMSRRQSAQNETNRNIDPCLSPTMIPSNSSVSPVLHCNYKLQDRMLISPTQSSSCQDFEDEEVMIGDGDEDAVADFEADFDLRLNEDVHSLASHHLHHHRSLIEGHKSPLSRDHIVKPLSCTFRSSVTAMNSSSVEKKRVQELEEPTHNDSNEKITSSFNEITMMSSTTASNGLLSTNCSTQIKKTPHVMMSPSGNSLRGGSSSKSTAVDSSSDLQWLWNNNASNSGNKDSMTSNPFDDKERMSARLSPLLCGDHISDSCHSSQVLHHHNQHLQPNICSSSSMSPKRISPVLTPVSPAACLNAKNNHVNVQHTGLNMNSATEDAGVSSRIDSANDFKHQSQHQREHNANMKSSSKSSPFGSPSNTSQASNSGLQNSSPLKTSLMSNGVQSNTSPLNHNNSNSPSNSTSNNHVSSTNNTPREVLIEGVLFRARYLGSTQLTCEGQPTKATRMIQAEEAVSRIKSLAPEGDPSVQPSTEVDLFISTEKIMVLNTDLKEIMMDHSLRTISYIADIGDLLVLMARRRVVNPSGSDSDSGRDPTLTTSSSHQRSSHHSLESPTSPRSNLNNSTSNSSSIPSSSLNNHILGSSALNSSPNSSSTSKQRVPKMICHVFESEEAQFIAQSIGQAFQVAYMEFLKANGIEDSSFVKEMDYQEVLNSQEIFGDELEMFAKKDKQKEVIVPKQKGEILGMVIVESGWGSMLPTVVIANMAQGSPSARCGHLNIGDQIIAINGISLVGLPLSTCQNYIKNTKNQTAIKLTVVPCPPVVEVKIKRPDTKYQLGFSVQNGVICSLLRGGIAERGGVRVGHRIIEINGQSVVAVPHERIVNLLATSVGQISMRTMPTSMYRLLTGQESPAFI